MTTHHEHPAYNDALRQAVRIAAASPIWNSAAARIWVNGDKMGVAGRYDPEFSDGIGLTVAYVQKWDAATVQIRESGAASTFVKI